METGTLLIIDDTQTSATALELACEDVPGVEVRAVFSAREAVRLLEREDDDVCAVITDVHMPDMDGFQLVEFIRGHARHAAIPVIVVTSDTDPDTPDRMARLGANAYFGKPFSPGAVRRALERLLHERQVARIA